MTNQADDAASDDTLPPSEATDSDELRNDDGDEMVTAPDHWQEAEKAALSDETAQGESLDDKLAAEEPDARVAGSPPILDDDDDVEVRRHRGQVGGSPEDGDSFFESEA